jgi:pilus assembly protein Flp/PilA
MLSLLNKFRRNQSGATAIEYGLIVALMSIVSIVAWQNIGTNMKAKMTAADASISAAEVK